MCALILIKFLLVEQSTITYQKHFKNNFMNLFQVEDGDSGDEVTLDLKGPDARMFQITPKGQLRPCDWLQTFFSTERIMLLSYFSSCNIWSNPDAELIS
jgi:hypothetical protein